MRKWSIEMYSKFRGFAKKDNMRHISKKTPAGRIAHEHFELLEIGVKNQHAGCLEYIKMCDELREAKAKKINLIKK